jgi:DNA-binding protein H-NS
VSENRKTTSRASAPNGRLPDRFKVKTMAKNKNAALSQLQTKIEAEQAKYKLAVLAAIEHTLIECGLTLADLMGAKPAAKRASTTAVKTRKAPFKGKQPPKYRDPKTGATWSGKGRAPGWIANVRSRERFLIEQQ